MPEFETILLGEHIRNLRHPRWHKENIVCVDSTFSSCNLFGAVMRHGVLSNVHFYNCILRRADFVGSQLRRVTFESCALDGSDFSEAYLSEVRWESSNLNGVDFSRARLASQWFVESQLNLLKFDEQTTILGEGLAPDECGNVHVPFRADLVTRNSLGEIRTPTHNFLERGGVHFGGVPRCPLRILVDAFVHWHGTEHPQNALESWLISQGVRLTSHAEPTFEWAGETCTRESLRQIWRRARRSH